MVSSSRERHWSRSRPSRDSRRAKSRCASKKARTYFSSYSVEASKGVAREIKVGEKEIRRASEASPPPGLSRGINISDFQLRRDTHVTRDPARSLVQLNSHLDDAPDSSDFRRLFTSALSVTQIQQITLDPRTYAPLHRRK